MRPISVAKQPKLKRKVINHQLVSSARGVGGGRGEEGICGCVKRRSKRGHSMRETSGSGANELSESNEQLLVGPGRGLGGQV